MDPMVRDPISPDLYLVTKRPPCIHTSFRGVPEWDTKMTLRDVAASCRKGKLSCWLWWYVHRGMILEKEGHLYKPFFGVYVKCS